MIRNLIKDQQRLSQQRLFWLLQLGGWFAWGLVGKYAYTRAMLEEDTAPGYFIYVMAITVIAIVLSLGLRYVYRWLMNRAIWSQVVGLLLGTALAGYAWLQARTYIYTHWLEK